MTEREAAAPDAPAPPEDAFMWGYAACYQRMQEEGRLLPAEGRPAPQALDVERLARVLAAINPPQFAEPKQSGEINAHLRPWNPQRFTVQLAEAISREYARLSRLPSEEER